MSTGRGDEVFHSLNCGFMSDSSGDARKWTILPGSSRFVPAQSTMGPRAAQAPADCLGFKRWAASGPQTPATAVGFKANRQESAENLYVDPLHHGSGASGRCLTSAMRRQASPFGPSSPHIPFCVYAHGVFGLHHRSPAQFAQTVVDICKPIRPVTLFIDGTQLPPQREDGQKAFTGLLKKSMKEAVTLAKAKPSSSVIPLPRMQLLRIAKYNKASDWTIALSEKPPERGPPEESEPRKKP